MTDNLIPISLIGNYLYCPYSIYLHNVYMEADDSVYKAEHLIYMWLCIIVCGLSVSLWSVI